DLEGERRGRAGMRQTLEHRVGPEMVRAVGVEPPGATEPQIHSAGEFDARRRDVALDLRGQGVGERLAKDLGAVQGDREEVPGGEHPGAVERVDGREQEIEAYGAVRGQAGQGQGDDIPRWAAHEAAAELVLRRAEAGVPLDAGERGDAGRYLGR